MAVLLHLGSDLVKIGVQCPAQLTHSVVSAAHADGRNVQLEREGLCQDAAQKSIPDGLGQLVLIRQAAEHLAQVAHVATVRRGGHAQHVGFGEPIKYTAVAVSDGMVGFIDDDGTKVVMRERFQPLRPL